MRKTEASGWMGRSSSKALRRGLQFAAVALGVGLVMTTGAARAQDDDEDDKTFEEKIIEGIMAGVGGTNMENRRTPTKRAARLPSRRGKRPSPTSSKPPAR
jgi:hypothetical protein